MMQITIPNEIIHQFLEDNEEGMRQLITYFLNAVMKEEARIQSGALPYERTSSRKAYRNGYRKRQLKTKYGTVELLKPQLREIPFKTRVFERYSRVEKAFRNAIIESYIQGVSTRRIKQIVEALSDEEISPQFVSNVAKGLNEKVKEFLNRPIEEELPYLFVDASYFKVRDEKAGRYRTKALLIVAGVRKDGYREILGLKLVDSEGEGFWLELFEELKERGLKGVELVISDGHRGIRSAVEKAFIGASWQMCHVHFIRDVLKKVPKKGWKRISRRLKESLMSAESLKKFIEELEMEGFKDAARTCERYMEDLFNYQAFPEEHWRRIRTTNMLERVAKELKRRARVVGAFPNEESLIRLAGCILIDINEEWMLGRRYLNMDDFLDTANREVIENFTAIS